MTKTTAGYILTPGGNQLVLSANEEKDAIISRSLNNNNTESFNNVNKNDDKLLLLSENIAPEDKEHLWVFLSSVGVDRNHLTESLVSQEFMTIEYIQAHIDELERAGKSFPQWAGLLIRNLQSGERPIPPAPKQKVFL
jgi:hypothetical protein